MAGWSDFFGGLMNKLPIQGRIERWKNEIDNLTKERKTLLQGKADEKKSARVDIIDKRISELQQLCKNKVAD
jgi:hypothetical protein